MSKRNGSLLFAFFLSWKTKLLMQQHLLPFCIRYWLVTANFKFFLGTIKTNVGLSWGIFPLASCYERALLSDGRDKLAFFELSQLMNSLSLVILSGLKPVEKWLAKGIGDFASANDQTSVCSFLKSGKNIVLVICVIWVICVIMRNEVKSEWKYC